MTSRPRRVGSFFISRSSARSKLRAVPSRRSTSSRVRSMIEIRCRRAGGWGGRRSSRITCRSPIGLLLAALDQKNAVDLVDLDELHLDALVARGRQVLADVVGANRKLAVAAVGEDGELDAGRAAVVDEDDRHALEREVELGRAHHGLRVQRRLSPAHVDVVAVEGDVDAAGLDLAAAELLDQTAQALRQRHAARVDADERDRVEIGVPLDDLVRDPRQGAPDRFGIEQDLVGGDTRFAHAYGCGLAGTDWYI